MNTRTCSCEIFISRFV